MRIMKKMFGQTLKIELGFKASDFISAEDARFYARLGEATPKVRKLHKKICITSAKYGAKEWEVKGLSKDEVTLLHVKGYRVVNKIEYKTNGTPIVKDDVFIVKLRKGE